MKIKGNAEMDILENGSVEDKIKMLAQTENMSVLGRASIDPVIEVRQVVACHPMTDEMTLQALAQDKDPGVRMLVAGNVNTPVETLDVLYRRDPEKFIRLESLENLRMPESVLIWALRNGSAEEQEVVASHYGATPAVLKMAIGSQDPSVRRAAAANLNADEDILLRALDDTDNKVREEAAKNDNATLLVIDKALKDKNENVRAIAVLHEVVTDEMASRIMDIDSSGKVRNALDRRAKVNELEASVDLPKDEVDKMPVVIGGVKLTYAQRILLSEGKSIQLSGVRLSDGEKGDFKFRMDGNRVVSQNTNTEKNTKEGKIRKIQRRLGL